MTNTGEPIEEANEADVAEQVQSADGRDPLPTKPEYSSDEANEADVLEQGAVVEDDEDGYDREDEE